MRTVIRLIVAAIVLSVPTTAWSDSSALLEFKENGKTYRGKLVAHNKQTCWVMGQDGRLNELQFDQISGQRKVGPRFRGHTAGILRGQLLREFGNGYDVKGSEHYLVCAKKGRAEKFVPLFEDVYRTFYVYFSTRGLRISKPEFPLIAVIYPDRKSFLNNCKRDGIRAIRGLRGYYLPLSNRVSLFETGNRSSSRSWPGSPSRSAEGTLANLFGPHNDARPASWMSVSRGRAALRINRSGNIDSGLRGTIVHETTHQVAFNTGLHPRLGENPTWIVEGVATVFEAPGARTNSRGKSAKTRINHERFVRFGRVVKGGHKPGTLEAFLGGDSMFQTNPLDAYARAWALSFYLIETRSPQYSRYLKSIAARNPMQAYPRSDRIADFKKAFGKDIDWLNVELLRYFERLNR